MNDKEKEVLQELKDDAGIYHRALAKLVKKGSKVSLGNMKDVISVVIEGLSISLSKMDSLFEEEGKMFDNYYKCPKCNNEWRDSWYAKSDDECSKCGSRDISPYKSEDVI